MAPILSTFALPVNSRRTRNPLLERALHKKSLAGQGEFVSPAAISSKRGDYPTQSNAYTSQRVSVWLHAVAVPWPAVFRRANSSCSEHKTVLKRKSRPQVHTYPHKRLTKAMTKGRLEAFSDGVIAILITIMVLELKVPQGADWEALRPLLPVFLSYVLSFVFLGIYWNNHHHMLHAASRVSGRILWANLHLLFWLSLIPFVTGWMGENHAAPLPTAVYG